MAAIDWISVRRWMRRELALDGERFADTARVLQATTVAEEAAAAFGLEAELDDPDSKLWGLAADEVTAATAAGGWNV